MDKGEMRKSHRKSRLGCRICKRRKVKCDEVRPECGNCVRFGVTCNFSPIPPKDNTRAARKSSRRGRPRSDWASWAEQIRLSSTGDSSPCCQRLNVDDLELFHNYMSSTAPSLGNEKALWTEGAPRLGFQHPCILDLMLTLSAYQLAKKIPADATRFLELAERHSTDALQAATVFLRSLSPENSPALYITSVLVCLSEFAQGPSPGNLLLVAEDGQVSWLSLIRGVRLVVSSTGWSSIFSGPLAQYLPSPQPDSEPQPVGEGADGKLQDSPRPALPPGGIEDWRSSLNDISDLIDLCAEQPLRQAYRHELEILKGCFETTFGKGRHVPVDADGKMQTVIGWIYQVEDPFVQGLHKKEPISLIILGHFCVLLRTLERYWFIEGWASHIMNEILQTSEVSRKWLSWPAQYLRGQSTSPGASLSPEGSWVTV